MKSLEVLQEVREWAVWCFLARLLEAEDSTVFGRVLLPLGMDREIILHPLVTEVHFLVAPVRCCHLRCSDDLSDLQLGAAELLWLVHRIHCVQECSRSDRRKLVHEVRVAICSCWEGVGTARDKTESPREYGCSFRLTILRE